MIEAIRAIVVYPFMTRALIAGGGCFHCVRRFWA